MDLAVSIVSYRTPDLLATCLTAVEHHRVDLRCEVTVVDNASGDGSADLVAQRFPWVHLVRNARNVGYGAAHNQTLREAVSRARHLLVLNADAAPTRGALRRLVEFLDAHPDVAVVGPRLRYPDGRTQPSRRRFPSALTLFLESTQAQRFWPDNAALRRYYLADRTDDETQDVDWLVGACLCVRAEAARRVGLFDERFFLYSEELDWCRRFRAAGWRVVYYPEAEVVHLEGASTRLDLAARDRHFQASKLRYAETWHGWPTATALRTYLVLEYLARALEESVRLALGSRVEERRARLRVIGSGLRHILRG
jgi:N-acetylglucosaminyl-diphospho-decaprenol L-rhamnosyltransferase